MLGCCWGQVKRTQDQPELVPKDIDKDLHRTFPDNSFFERKESITMLQHVLAAYAKLLMIHDHDSM